MDWLNFLASLINSLAWPAAVVVGILILRRALSRLIPDLNLLRYKDLELRFGRQLENVRQHLEAQPKVALPPPAVGGEPEANEAQKSNLIPYFEAIAEISPRAAILEAWIGFETTASSSAQKLDLMPVDRHVSMPELIRALHRGQLITQEESEALTKLRALRNEVVHAYDQRLSIAKAAEYASLVREISEKIAYRAWQRMPKNC